ncbi:MAG: tetraacyldisaccharide 4'-kinase [Gammaproteobacteria bacterium]
MTSNATLNRLEQYWYSERPLSLALVPVSWIYRLLVALRRLLYRLRLLPVTRLPVPVVVVGNLTVGGTGKTPLVIALANLLKAKGFRPGLVSRGYGGTAASWPQQVRRDSDPVVVGDEAVLLARRTRCPMAVGPDRVAAALALLKYSDCDVILSDDGLQHYALARDIEIAVIDGIRRLGNGHLLPAGPLREPKRRIKKVDFVVANGGGSRGEFSMQVRLGLPRRLLDDRDAKGWEEFRGKRFHAVAGIGHPERFFAALKKLGLDPIEQRFPDHHAFREEDLHFKEAGPVLMTEKDAVKCQRFAKPDHWYVPIEAELDPRFEVPFLRKLSGVKKRFATPADGVRVNG